MSTILLRSSKMLLYLLLLLTDKPKKVIFNDLAPVLANVKNEKWKE